MKPGEFELTPDLVRRCRRYGLDAVIEIERWKTLMRSMDVPDARASFLQYVAGRRRKPILHAVAMLLFLAACRREVPVAEQPTTTRAATQTTQLEPKQAVPAVPEIAPQVATTSAATPAPKFARPIPSIYRTPLPAPVIGYPAPARRVQSLAEIAAAPMEKGRAVEHPSTGAAAMILIGGFSVADDGKVFRVKCDGARGQCVVENGRCVALLELVPGAPHSCAWGFEPCEAPYSGDCGGEAFASSGTKIE